MKFKHDGYDHTRLPKTKRTKELMSKAKKGRKYSETHKHNMRVTQILNACKRYDIEPVKHIINHFKYTPEEKHNILVSMRERNITGADDGLAEIHL